MSLCPVFSRILLVVIIGDSLQMWPMYELSWFGSQRHSCLWQFTSNLLRCFKLTHLKLILFCCNTFYLTWTFPTHTLFFFASKLCLQKKLQRWQMEVKLIEILASNFGFCCLSSGIKEQQNHSKNSNKITVGAANIIVIEITWLWCFLLRDNIKVFYFSLSCEEIADHYYPQFVVCTTWRLGRRGGCLRGYMRPWKTQQQNPKRLDHPGPCSCTTSHQGKIKLFWLLCTV